MLTMMIFLAAPFLAKGATISCGGGLRVDSQILDDGSSFDEKVEGIQGSWEAGCDACGNYLEEQDLINPGWYCEKNLNFGIWLKRDRGDVYCGSVNGDNLRLELSSSVIFDVQVKGISNSSWEDGCDACGVYLEEQDLINPGWYCEKNLNYGIWIKRGWPVLLHNAKWKKELPESVPPIGDWRHVYRDGKNIANYTKITNWDRDESQFQHWSSLLFGLGGKDALHIKQGANTKIMIGGFTNGPGFYTSSNWLQEYGNSDFDGNLLALDWTKWNANERSEETLLNNPFYYYSACENARTMGLIMAGFLTDLMDLHAIQASQVHCIGHSLGAQICGYIGRTLNSSGRTLGRISATDPAGPDWTGARDRLTKNDASFVDVIHTNGGIEPRRLPTEWLGNLEPSGHVDFYLNGGEKQPFNFCGNPTWVNGCHHELSNYYFAYSINHDILGSLCWTSTVEECLEQGRAPSAPGSIPEDPKKRVPIGERATLEPVPSIPWSSAQSAQTETTRAYFVFVNQTDGIPFPPEAEEEIPRPIFTEQIQQRLRIRGGK